MYIRTYASHIIEKLIEKSCYFILKAVIKSSCAPPLLNKVSTLYIITSEMTKKTDEGFNIITCF